MLRQVLDLGLSEDDVGVRAGALVHVRLVDYEQDRLGLADGHARHAVHGLQAQLAEELASLLLRPRLLAALVRDLSKLCRARLTHLLRESGSLGDLGLIFGDHNSAALALLLVGRAVARGVLLGNFLGVDDHFRVEVQRASLKTR